MVGLRAEQLPPRLEQREREDNGQSNTEQHIRLHYSNTERQAAYSENQYSPEILGAAESGGRKTNLRQVVSVATASTCNTSQSMKLETYFHGNRQK